MCAFGMIQYVLSSIRGHYVLGGTDGRRPINPWTHIQISKVDIPDGGFKIPYTDPPIRVNGMIDHVIGRVSDIPHECKSLGV